MEGCRSSSLGLDEMPVCDAVKYDLRSVNCNLSFSADAMMAPLPTLPLLPRKEEGRGSKWPNRTEQGGGRRKRP